MTQRFENLFNIIALALFFSVAGLWWDAWWHVTIGRDSMWIPPHLLQYTNVLVLFFSAIYLYLKTKLKIYRIALIAVVIFILMAPADEVWHHFFGSEDLTTVLAIWSPPHILAILANLFIAITFLAEWVKNYTASNKTSFLRIVLTSSVCLSMLNFIMLPLQPFGWHFILGPIGILITTSILVLYILLIAYSLPNSGIVFYSILTFLIFVGFRGTNPAPNILLPAHAEPPLWLDFIALTPLSLFIEFIKIRNYHPVLIGGILGFFIYFFYWIFWQFIERPESFYDQSEAFIFIIFSTIAGCLAGTIYLIIKKSQIIKSLER